jgi:hypothetical protein
MRTACTSTVLNLLDHAIDRSERAVVDGHIHVKVTHQSHRLSSQKSVAWIFTDYNKGLPTQIAFEVY